MATGLPSTKICPTSGVCTPARIFMSVLLPAPFSPMTATTSPRPSDRLTAVSARTPGKLLLTSRTSRRGWWSGGVVEWWGRSIRRSVAFSYSATPLLHHPTTPLLSLLLPQVGPELGDAVLADLAGRDVHELALGDNRLVPARQRRQHPH